MARQRKKFDTSLKLEVVRMIKEQGLSVQHVSQSMDIGQTAIRRWLTQYDAEQSGRWQGLCQGRTAAHCMGLVAGIKCDSRDGLCTAPALRIRQSWPTRPILRQ
ncbi:MAG: transposase [Glaciimonas sp.]|nr:transposase [Glaciimonas sp.]